LEPENLPNLCFGEQEVSCWFLMKIVYGVSIYIPALITMDKSGGQVLVVH